MARAILQERSYTVAYKDNDQDKFYLGISDRRTDDTLFLRNVYILNWVMSHDIYIALPIKDKLLAEVNYLTLCGNFTAFELSPNVSNHWHNYIIEYRNSKNSKMISEGV